MTVPSEPRKGRAMPPYEDCRMRAISSIGSASWAAMRSAWMTDASVSLEMTREEAEICRFLPDSTLTPSGCLSPEELELDWAP